MPAKVGLVLPRIAAGMLVAAVVGLAGLCLTASVASAQDNAADLQRLLREKDRALAQAKADFIAELAASAKAAGDLERWLRFAVHAARIAQRTDAGQPSNAQAELRRAVQAVEWRYRLPGVAALPIQSPDGKRFVLDHGDGLELWDAQEFRVLAHKPSKTPFVAQSFTPDSTKFVTVDNDGFVTVYRVASGLDELSRVRVQGDKFALSPDGRFVAAVPRRDSQPPDNTASIYDAASGRLVTVLRGHTTKILSIAFSPDGTRVVTSSISGDRTVRVWETATGKPLLTLSGTTDATMAAAISPDNTRIITRESYVSRVWDARDGRQLYELHEPDGFLFAMFSPDGSRIITQGSEWGSRVIAWDVASGRRLGTFAMKARRFESVAASGPTYIEGGGKVVTYGRFGEGPDGDVVLSDPITLGRLGFLRGGSEQLRWIWDLRGKIETVLPAVPPDQRAKGYTQPFEFSADRSKIVIVTRLETPVEYQIVVWDLKSRRKLLSTNAASPSAAISPDGSYLATDAGDDVVVRRVDNGREVARLRGQNFSEASFNADGRRMVTVATPTGRGYDPRTGKEVRIDPSMDRLAHVWELPSGREIARFSPGDVKFEKAAIAADGNRIATTSSDAAVQVWDLASGRQITTFNTSDFSLSNMALTFSRDGRRLLAGHKEPEIWDSVTGRSTIRLAGAIYPTNLTFSRDGAKVAGIQPFQDVLTTVWNAATGEKIAFLPYGRSVEFSADGATIAVASEEGVAVYDLATGRELAVAALPEGAVSAVYDPDGSRIVIVSSDGAVRTWDIRALGQPVADLLRDACFRRLRGATTLSPEEMYLAGYGKAPEIDVCAGVQ